MKKYPLLFGIIFSTLIFSCLGNYWNIKYYDSSNSYSVQNLPLCVAMKGFYDGVVESDWNDFCTLFNRKSDETLLTQGTEPECRPANVLKNKVSLTTNETPDSQKSISGNVENIKALKAYDDKELEIPVEDSTEISEQNVALSDTIDFTNVSDEYFNDAVFLGDSRTVGIKAYSGIENATFLCKESLTIYDYDKNKIKYGNSTTSIKKVLSTKQFGKVYIMFGINECNYGTTESYLKAFENVVSDIRQLQPSAIIFIEGNLLVTQKRSSQGGITNAVLSERNAAIATLANQKDIFYIDVNESTLCVDNALIPEYTWDNVHIKAKYYSIWKDFLLNHGIIIS